MAHAMWPSSRHWIDRDERTKEKPRDAQPVRVADEARVELLCVPGEHHDQGVRVAGHGLRAADADH